MLLPAGSNDGVKSDGITIGQGKKLDQLKNHVLVHHYLIQRAAGMRGPGHSLIPFGHEHVVKSVEGMNSLSGITQVIDITRANSEQPRIEMKIGCAEARQIRDHGKR